MYRYVSGSVALKQVLSFEDHKPLNDSTDPWCGISSGSSLFARKISALYSENELQYFLKL